MHRTLIIALNELSRSKGVNELLMVPTMYLNRTQWVHYLMMIVIMLRLPEVITLKFLNGLRKQESE